MVGVRLTNITKRYGAAAVVRDLSVAIAPGELFFLLGPSGCGKTTVLRMIAGFLEPTSGTIHFDDRDMDHVPPNARNTGMVFQSYALWPHMTIGENVAFGLDVRRVAAADRRARVARAQRLVRMEDYRARFPHQLSGGQQQRVALARALVIEPDVVLLDEPLSNLDAGLRIEMRKEISRIHAELGITMIYVTHDQKEALSLATRMAVMQDGGLAQVAAPVEMYQNPATLFVATFVGETNVIAGTVTGADAATYELTTPCGAVHLPRDRAAQLFAAGDCVALSIRPEGFAFSTDARAGNAWPARVVESTYLGEIVQAVCALGRQQVRVTALNTAGPPPRPGDACTLVINPAHCRMLAPA
jgi:iron(III) transport system ATP-binding protein